MTHLQKAMVLLDIARGNMSEYAEAISHIASKDADRHDLLALIDDIDRVVYALETFSKWPDFTS